MLDSFKISGYRPHMTDLFPFLKMHGLGNDFVIIDSRDRNANITADLVKRLANRHYGIGFDQLAVINKSSEAHIALSFFNSDGSTAGACGNATRCIAKYEMDRLQIDEVSIITDRGILRACRKGNLVSVNMGQPLLEWSDIPLAKAIDTLKLPLEGTPTATGMGNPHCTFFVADAESVELETLGPEIEGNPLFPESTNVQVAHVISKNCLRLRVWERGVGLTLASGSSACAAAVAAARLGMTGRSVIIEPDGGSIHIDWREDGVWMTGATMHVFNGIVTKQFLDNLT